MTVFAFYFPIESHFNASLNKAEFLWLIISMLRNMKYHLIAPTKLNNHKIIANERTFLTTNDGLIMKLRRELILTEKLICSSTERPGSSIKWSDNGAEGRRCHSRVQGFGQPRAINLLDEKGLTERSLRVANLISSKMCNFILSPPQSGSGKSQARIGEGPILTLERVERLQSGVYQCTAENNVGEPVTVDMRLDVLCKLTSSLNCR